MEVFFDGYIAFCRHQTLASCPHLEGVYKFVPHLKRDWQSGWFLAFTEWMRGEPGGVISENMDRYGYYKAHNPRMAA